MSTIKWKMLGYTSFVGEADGHTVTLEVKGAIAPYWEIREGKRVVAHAMQFKPTKCELTAKQQAQRVLDDLVKAGEAPAEAPTETSQP